MSGASKEVENNRLLELEGLRGISSFVVVVGHFLLAFYSLAIIGPTLAGGVQHMRFEDNIYGSPISGLISGTFAVAIFFVLSGFVLSIGFFQTGNVNNVKKMAIKRYLRLMLPALGSLMLCFVLVRLGLSRSVEVSRITGSDWLSNVWDQDPNIFGVIFNGVYEIFFNSISHYNGVLWTMTTELFGSFLVFVFLLVFSDSKYRWMIYGLLLVMSVNSWFLCFVAGMIMADLYSRNKLLSKKRINLIFFWLLLIVAIYFGGYPTGSLSNTAYSLFEFLDATVFDYRRFFLSLGAIILVYLFLYSKQLKKIFGSRIISSSGKYTFSLYLVHMPILFTLTMGIFLAIYPILGYNLAAALSFVLSLPVIFAAAYIFERYIDAPAIRFSSRIANIYLNKKNS